MVRVVGGPIREEPLQQLEGREQPGVEKPAGASFASLHRLTS
jgi:hypothetical protein